jgi:hypothetical protein
MDLPVKSSGIQGQRSTPASQPVPGKCDEFAQAKQFIVQVIPKAVAELCRMSGVKDWHLLSTKRIGCVAQIGNTGIAVCGMA